MKRFWMAGVGLGVGTMLAGCVNGPYVDPAEFNPVAKGAYTRAESIPAGQRLVDAMLLDPVFAQHCAAKAQQRGGTPVLQVANFGNLSFERNGRALAALRSDIETALRASGRFLLSGDPDACDYILHGDYCDIPDGRRTSHRLTLRLHDIANDLDVWTGSDEIAKE